MVDNLDAYRKSLITKASLDIVSSAAAPDATHVLITLTDPMVAFAALLATQVGYVVAPAMLKSGLLIDRPIGTGAFTIQNNTKDQSWMSERNAKYWRAGLPHLDAIEYRPIPDNEKRYNLLTSGDIDLINVRSPKEIIELRPSKMKVVENSAGEEEYILLNTQAPPFESKIAREAVAYAVDPARWRKEILLDVDPVANSPFAPGQLGYLAENGYPKYDLAKAKQLVEQYTKETARRSVHVAHPGRHLGAAGVATRR